MTEKIVEEEKIEDGETDAKEDKADPQDKGKTFSQEDVNKIVAREKAAWKRQHDKVIADKDGEIELTRSNQKDAEKIVAEQVKTLKADLKIDDDEWELTMADRDVFTQYVYLVRKVEKSGKKHVEETPRGERSGNATFERLNRV